jgi:hypothetical protein
MTHCPFGLRVAVLAACAALVSITAHAFTFEGGGAAADGTPKFDIEEQAKNFGKSGSDLSAATGNAVDTPIGKLQFGVQQGPSAFGSPFGSSFGSSSALQDRRYFDQMLAPPTSQEGFR